MSRGHLVRAMHTRCLLLCGAIVLIAGRAQAQPQATQLVLSSGALLFPSPRLSNYQTIPAGATTPVSDSVSLDFTVARLADLYWRNTIVKMRCVLVTGGKPCTDVQWRYQGTSAWQDITTIDTSIDSRWIVPGFFNDPWSGRIWLRMKLSWTNDAPATYAATVAVTVDVYRP